MSASIKDQSNVRSSRSRMLAVDPLCEFESGDASSAIRRSADLGLALLWGSTRPQAAVMMRRLIDPKAAARGMACSAII
jgi:hypothetical protein